jgi:hypothetical protein
MTTHDEGKQLRAEIAKLRPDKRRRYSEELKSRILDWVGRATATGMAESDCGRLLGVRTWRLRTWRSEEAAVAGAASEPLALVRVDAPSCAVGAGLVVVAPSGYRIEGLTLDQVGVLLREVA